MADDELYDKRRGQRMLLTKWIKAYNSTDDGEKERAAHTKWPMFLLGRSR